MTIGVLERKAIPLLELAFVVALGDAAEDFTIALEFRNETDIRTQPVPCSFYDSSKKVLSGRLIGAR